MLRDLCLINGLYHKDLLWSNKFYYCMLKELNCIERIKLSYHCIEQINLEWRRKYKNYNLEIETIKKAILFEVEIENNSIIKYVVRTKFNYDYDISIVFIINKDKKELFVKTMWLNSRKDKHKTLDSVKYVCKTR